MINNEKGVMWLLVLLRIAFGFRLTAGLKGERLVELHLGAYWFRLGRRARGGMPRMVRGPR